MFSMLRALPINSSETTSHSSEAESEIHATFTFSGVQSPMVLKAASRADLSVLSVMGMRPFSGVTAVMQLVYNV